VGRYNHGRGYRLFTLEMAGKPANKKDLERFLGDRGILCTGRKKDELVAMYKLAAESDLEVDPDGIRDDMGVTIAAKLQLDDGSVVTKALDAETEAKTKAQGSWLILLTVLSFPNR